MASNDQMIKPIVLSSELKWENNLNKGTLIIQNLTI